MPDEPARENGPLFSFSLPPFHPPRDTDERGRLLPMTEEQRRARVELWDETVRKLEATTDETDDDDEVWDQIMRNLGVDPATGRGLNP